MRSRSLTGTLLTGTLLLLGAAPAQAATCADHSSQAAAQAAADTRDADGDGVFCESLPCPCARGGSTSSGTSPSSGSRARAERGARARARAEARRRAGVRRRRAAERHERLRRHRLERGAWRIARVIDGDTIAVRRTDGSARETVRLIGIDTPETRKPGVRVECGGRQATSGMLALGFTAPRDTDGDGLLDAAGGTGRLVRLRTDRSQDVRDAYGRALAYVAAGPVDLGRVMLDAGLAVHYVYDATPFERVAAYRAADAAAEARGTGTWAAPCHGDFHSEQ